MVSVTDHDWLTVEQVAELFQVTPETVRRWIRSGKLKVLDLHSRKAGYRLNVGDVRQFIQDNYRTVGDGAEP